MAAKGQHKPALLAAKKNKTIADWVTGDGSVEEEEKDQTEHKHEQTYWRGRGLDRKIKIQ